MTTLNERGTEIAAIREAARCHHSLVRALVSVSTHNLAPLNEPLHEPARLVSARLVLLRGSDAMNVDDIFAYLDSVSVDGPCTAFEFT